MFIKKSSVSMSSQSSHLNFIQTEKKSTAFKQQLWEQKKLQNTTELIPMLTSSNDILAFELSNGILRNLFLLSHMSHDVLDLEFTRVEKEVVNFQTKAFIQTQNKEISIDIDVCLQRSFMQKINLTSEQEALLMDPLVISLDGDLPELSEDKFCFDIDSDGISDQISKLKGNSGFLALDKNENSKIDDGSELFGTKSGDGFSELSLYDEDGNNWIDENDKIFDKLRIWQKVDGRDKLISLGEAGVGAIFLGNMPTSFSFKDNQNATLGKMVSSGFFLFEDGKSGTLSQVDLALQNKEKTTKKGLDLNSLGFKNFNRKNFAFNEKTFNAKLESITLEEVLKIGDKKIS